MLKLSPDSSLDRSTVRDMAAPFRARLRSFLVDLGLYLFIVVWAIESVAARLGVEQSKEWGTFVIASLLFWVGFVAIGVTPASWLFDIRIVDPHGRMPGPWRAVRRSLVPGTTLFLCAGNAYFFHPWIDATYEAHTVIEVALFWTGFGGSMFSFWIYLAQGGREDQVTHLHDAIAGTRVVSHRSERKAALIRQLGNLEAFLCRWSDPNLPERGSCHVQALCVWRKRNGCRES